ncbi:MAG TPA: UDP-N-acetylglucosamine 2-epimerase (non-hydrolyzing) [Ktedonobacterales bacterium]|jgi:UDP-N-acetylglucosamine 2-epimerase|nr:UDP-N-acetylglucosamine 2-epimerase (non-hydrolyzing) [Ktedonobacterales bacterium]
MRTILSVIGTRPEAIKMAPVVKELQRRPADFASVVCSTGQHREMLDQALQLFNITPDIDLNLMTHNQGLAQLTARLFTALDDTLAQVRPDAVLAQGDTTTVLVASLTAFYRGIPFGHVEAGLRTGDKRRPFPEEINRRLADAVSDLFFAPTERARQALLREGCPDDAITVTGNTVIDALLDIASRPYAWRGSPLAELPEDGQYVLITAHRRESFGEAFRQLCLAIRELADEFAPQGLRFVYPVHLNPNVRQPVGEILGPAHNITLLEPLDYFSLVQVMKRSRLILTDSGGIQEEAPSLGVPALVMRETTERPEGVEAGVVKLVGADRERIVTEARRLLTDPAAHARMATRANPYGDGHAAERIVAVLKERLG